MIGSANSFWVYKDSPDTKEEEADRQCHPLGLLVRRQVEAGWGQIEAGGAEPHLPFADKEGSPIWTLERRVAQLFKTFSGLMFGLGFPCMDTPNWRACLLSSSLRENHKVKEL